MAIDSFNNLLELARSGKKADVLTVVAVPDGQDNLIGQMMILPEQSESCGQIGDAAFSEKLCDYVKSYRPQQPTVLEWDSPQGKYRLFYDRLTVQSQALILGAGHISQPLVQLLTLVGYGVTVIDDRPDFANPRRFPQAQKVICQPFTTALASVDLANYDAIIIVTRGHRYDLDCLRVVLKQPAPYTGMIGSQRRVRGILEMLATEGQSAEQLKRLKAPIGLDIGAQTPEEIALSIVSEVVAFSRSADCQPLSGKRR